MRENLKKNYNYIYIYIYVGLVFYSKQCNSTILYLQAFLKSLSTETFVVFLWKVTLCNPHSFVTMFHHVVLKSSAVWYLFIVFGK